MSVSDPATMNGLPMAAQDYGNVFVVRAQRKVFQQWKQDLLWARAGDVTVANGGDVGKEAGLYPAAAISPMVAPTGVLPATTPTTGSGCDPSYPTVCISPPPDSDCKDVTYRGFRVLPPDPRRFDADKDGIG